MIRTLERSIRPKMRIANNKISHELFERPELRASQLSIIKASTIVGKSFSIRLRLREYLPCTDSPSTYYLPHNLQLTLYILRNKLEQVARIDKQSAYVSSGIPVLLQNPTKMSYHGFTF